MGEQGKLVVETENVRLNREFVAARPGLSTGDHVRLSVSDSGPGMSQELAERAFNPFYTTQEDEGRLGLGLSVAYGFAIQSGGYIEIDASEFGGALVSLYFPRADKIVGTIGEDNSSRANLRKVSG